MRSIDFYFDFLTPLVYLARHRLSQIATIARSPAHA